MLRGNRAENSLSIYDRFVYNEKVQISVAFKLNINYMNEMLRGIVLRTTSSNTINSILRKKAEICLICKLNINHSKDCFEISHSI